MNKIQDVRDEILRYLNPDNIIHDSKETILSPTKAYRIETTSFQQNKSDVNWHVTKIDIYETSGSTLLFSFYINDEMFFHSWITKGKTDYLLCAEDLCGGQTVIDLSNKIMSSYTENNDGLIWTKHLLSPNEKLLAVLGCGWGSPYFVTVYHFDNPLDLPLRVAFEPRWTGYDLIDWIDNETLTVATSEGQFETLSL